MEAENTILSIATKNLPRVAILLAANKTDLIENNN